MAAAATTISIVITASAHSQECWRGFILEKNATPCYEFDMVIVVLVLLVFIILYVVSLGDSWPKATMADVERCVANGDVIGAIKAYRGATGAGLAEARKEVERRMAAPKQSVRVRARISSPAADKLTREKPSGWEYYLTVELLATHLRPILATFDELRNGARQSPVRAVNEQDFLQFGSEKLKTWAAFVESLQDAANKELMIAWGPLGVAGNATAIRQACSRIVHTCRELLEWERDMHSIQPPPQYDRLHRGLCGWGENLVRPFAELSERMKRVLSDPSASGQHVIELVLKPPANCDELGAELNRLNHETNAKLRSGQADARASADTAAAAALLGGIIGWWAGSHFLKHGISPEQGNQY